jgi:hypothetical protein
MPWGYVTVGLAMGSLGFMVGRYAILLELIGLCRG